MIPVAEIFGPTIQGEGPDVGLKTMFLRVVGCDFNCSWCDSKFAWKVSETTVKYEDNELATVLINRCKDSNCYSVIITGGNPCLYDFSSIITALHDANIKVGIETQGSILPDWLNQVDSLVISPKAPSSHQVDVLDKVYEFIENIHTYPLSIAIKIPIFDEADFKFALRYYKKFEYLLINDHIIKFYLSVGNSNTTELGDISKRILIDYKKLIDKVMVSDMCRVYILPQVHTLVWGNKQGV